MVFELDSWYVARIHMAINKGLQYLRVLLEIDISSACILVHVLHQCFSKFHGFSEISLTKIYFLIFKAWNSAK